MPDKGKLRQKACDQLDTFLSQCAIAEAEGKQILEIGFKNGYFLEQCALKGLKAAGLEINEDYYEAVKVKFPTMDVLLYDGGRFPVDDGSFDFVVSYQVLEHTANLKHVFSECVRVLKSGGVMYHVCPNYHSFYEGHLKVVWMPFFNKWTGRAYAKLVGKYRGGYENLNLVKPRKLKRILDSFVNEIEVISLGGEEFVSKFNSEQIEKIDQKLIKSIMKMILKFNCLKKILLRIIVKTNTYYPITIIAGKN